MISTFYAHQGCNSTSSKNAQRLYFQGEEIVQLSSIHVPYGKISSKDQIKQGKSRLTRGRCRIQHMVNSESAATFSIEGTKPSPHLFCCHWTLWTCADGTNPEQAVVGSFQRRWKRKTLLYVFLASWNAMWFRMDKKNSCFTENFGIILLDTNWNKIYESIKESLVEYMLFFTEQIL